MTTRWERIARQGAGEDYAVRYAERFRAMAERGEDVHGEAGFVAGLVPAPARVLDAGCGTGRVAVRLHELGYDVVGVDVDPTMLDQARAAAPELDWRLGDLASFDLPELRGACDVVLVAGNTIPLLEPGTLLDACERLGAHLAPDGVVVCGFGTDAAHLPGDCPVTPLADVDAAFGALGLDVAARYGTWDREAFDPAGGYAVTVYAEPRR
ncbi:class I SAM-dependent methyltransferase [Nocardioides pyridinolyticus]